MTTELTAALTRTEQQIRDAGYRLIYRPYVEDHLTPGFPGQIAGRTSRRPPFEVVLSTVATPSPILRLRVLKHELRHILDPDWDCGCRAVFDERPALLPREEVLVR